MLGSLIVGLVALVLLVVVTVRHRRRERVLTGEIQRQASLLDERAAANAEPTPSHVAAVLQAVPLGIVVVDPGGSIRFVNDAAGWFRRSRHGEAVVAQTIDELIVRALDGETVTEAVQLYGPPRRHLLVTASPIEASGGRNGALVVIDDVTERERTDAIRRDFVSNISHELRTPIGAMSLLAETLVGETDPAVVESLAGRLSREAERLATTVDDLLELSRIEHGGDVVFEPLVLQGVITGAHDRVRSAAQQRNVEIGVSLPERDLTVLGDRRQLTSAVFNLLDNAVKYCGPSGGTVAIRARQVDDTIEVSVQDNGVGIPRKDLDRIFERFYRVDRGRSRASGGTGLGLSMVRHIAANHGGAVSVDSTEGEGTTFTIELPAYPPPDHDPPAARSDGDRDDHEVTSP